MAKLTAKLNPRKRSSVHH